MHLRRVKPLFCFPCRVVKARKTDASRGARGRNKCLFVLYLDVNSIAKGSADEAGKLNGSLDFSGSDLQAIIDIAQQPDLLKLMVHSLCPAIYGHEVCMSRGKWLSGSPQAIYFHFAFAQCHSRALQMVKAGLLLGLFGGVQKNVMDRNKIAVRGDPHVLVVGDPGLGKSQMLRGVMKVRPVHARV